MCATHVTPSGCWFDVTIDKWDLKEGHDAIQFMEKMVTDPEIKKVIMVLDRRYAEKADDRKGGARSLRKSGSEQIRWCSVRNRRAWKAVPPHLLRSISWPFPKPFGGSLSSASSSAAGSAKKFRSLLITNPSRSPAGRRQHHSPLLLSQEIKRDNISSAFPS
jgi:SEFIR domain